MNKQKTFLWHHGTTKEHYKAVLKRGFKRRTYFTPWLDTAISYGGQYVFTVALPFDPQKSYWEWLSDKKIGSNKILHVRKFDITKVYLNKKETDRFLYGHVKSLCKHCGGAGERVPEKYKYRHIFEPSGGSFKNRPWKIKVCKVCKGYGYTGSKAKERNKNLLHEN